MARRLTSSEAETIARPDREAFVSSSSLQVVTSILDLWTRLHKRIIPREAPHFMAWVAEQIIHNRARHYAQGSNEDTIRLEIIEALSKRVNWPILARMTPWQGWATINTAGLERQPLPPADAEESPAPQPEKHHGMPIVLFGDLDLPKHE